MSRAAEALLPVLVHIQANLDIDLNLNQLSRKIGLSPSHFHRAFKAEIGETPADYVARLRLERAAFRLQLHETSVLEIALDCGYRNHETFTRAFRRAFGQSPSDYRAWSRRRDPHIQRPARSRSASETAPFEISATKVIRMRAQHLAFIRHVGPYEEVDDSLFEELDEWAHARRMPGPRIWMGIGHDAPGMTAPERLRFDAALVVPDEFEQVGRVGHQLLSGGEFAITTHVGPYSTLPAAYAAIFPRATALADHTLIGLPAVEIYRCAKVNVRLEVNETELCLPVTRRPR